MSCIGRFSCCKFRTFFTEVKVTKSSDISRNMLQGITMSTYANRSENMRPFTVEKAPNDIILTRTILVYFVNRK